MLLCAAGLLCATAASKCADLLGQELVSCRKEEVEQFADADAFYNLALALEQQEDWAAAANAWKEANALEPSDREIRQGHKECLARINNNNAASQRFEEENDESLINKKAYGEPAKIPRAPWPQALHYIKRRLPVIITSTPLVPDRIREDLSRIEYVKQAMKGSTFEWQVSHGRAGGGVYNRTRYWSQVEHNYDYDAPGKSLMTFDDFVKAGDVNTTDVDREVLYIAHALGSVKSEGISEDDPECTIKAARNSLSRLSDTLLEDVNSFDWNFIKQITQDKLYAVQWWFGWPGTHTQAHFDPQDNFVTQFIGSKRVVLFPPENVIGMYMHPVDHPESRQSQVDLKDPDLQRFPLALQVQPQEAILNAGESLFIPQFFWHSLDTPRVDQGGKGELSFMMNIWLDTPSPRVQFDSRIERVEAAGEDIETSEEQVNFDPFALLSMAFQDVQLFALEDLKLNDEYPTPELAYFFQDYNDDVITPEHQKVWDEHLGMLQGLYRDLTATTRQFATMCANARLDHDTSLTEDDYGRVLEEERARVSARMAYALKHAGDGEKFTERLLKLIAEQFRYVQVGQRVKYDGLGNAIYV